MKMQMKTALLLYRLQKSFKSNDLLAFCSQVDLEQHFSKKPSRMSPFLCCANSLLSCWASVYRFRVVACLDICSRYVLIMFLLAIPFLLPYVLFTIILPEADNSPSYQGVDASSKSIEISKSDPAPGQATFGRLSEPRGDLLLVADMGRERIQTKIVGTGTCAA